MSSISVSDFFKPMELNSYPADWDYVKVAPYIEMAKAIAKVTYQSIYLIDYYKRDFAYVSDNPIFLCGKTAAQVEAEGFRFYLQNIPPDDLEMLLKINEAGFLFYKDIPKEERLKYAISYDFHLIQANKSLILVNHKLTPLLLDKDANIWIALCFVSMSSGTASGNIKISRSDENRLYLFDLEKNEWMEQQKVTLKKKEREILILSGQGHTMETMAQKLFLSVDAIKFHRKKIFRKLGAKNISEAIAVAENLLLI